MPISLLAYSATPDKVFVRVPNERGRWVLTDRCVIEVECSSCKAEKGEPCFRSYGPFDPKHRLYWSGTHYGRRTDWQTLKRRQPELGDVRRSKPRLQIEDLQTQEGEE